MNNNILLILLLLVSGSIFSQTELKQGKVFETYYKISGHNNGDTISVEAIKKAVCFDTTEKTRNFQIVLVEFTGSFQKGTVTKTASWKTIEFSEKIKSILAAVQPGDRLFFNITVKDKKTGKEKRLPTIGHKTKL